VAGPAGIDGAVADYRLFAVNAQPGMPDREGVTLESPFVGPGMRGRSRLRYFPCRLSLVPDFVVGALHSPGGLAIIALPSWQPTVDVSTVVPRLDGPVTSFQHSYIVTEQGTATIWGQDAAGQAQQIINRAAHPAARDELRTADGSLGLRLCGPAESRLCPDRGQLGHSPSTTSRCGRTCSMVIRTDVVLGGAVFEQGELFGGLPTAAGGRRSLSKDGSGGRVVLICSGRPRACQNL